MQDHLDNIMQIQGAILSCHEIFGADSPLCTLLDDVLEREQEAYNEAVSTFLWCQIKPESGPAGV